MAERAPGQGVPRDEPECYNCGVKGHFAMACPEEVRKVPAGLEAHRLRKAASQSKGPQPGAGQSRGTNSMVITRYGPPPGAVQPALPPYPPAGLPHPPAGLPHPPPPPPPSVPQAVYPPPPSHPHAPGPWHHPPPGPWQPPPPASYGPTGYSAPPPQHAGYGAYDPYGQYAHALSAPPPAPPPPAPHGPPSFYQPYPSQTYYQGTPQPQYTLGPYPPPAPHPVAAPPLPAAYPAGPAVHPFPPVTYEAAIPYPHYPPPFPPDGSHPYTHDGRGRGSARQRGGSHHRGRDRDRDRDRDHGRDRNRDRDGDRDRDRRRFRKNASRQTDRTENSIDSAKPSRQVSISESDRREAAATQEKGRGRSSPDPADDDFQWELRAVFMEVSTKPADPVGMPLPAEYTDAPTIPPAFDAKAVKSAFFSPDDQAEFCRSIRDSKMWHIVKLDPAFAAIPGMIRRRFPNWPHEYTTYRTLALPDVGELILEGDAQISPTVRSRSLVHIPPGHLGKHGRGRINGDDEPHTKRFRGSHDQPSRPRYHSSPSGYGRHRESAGNGSSAMNADGPTHNHRGANNDRNGRVPHSRTGSNRGPPDSGYHSTNSSDRQLAGAERPRPSRESLRDPSPSPSPPRSREPARYDRRRRSISPRNRSPDGRRSQSATASRDGSSSPLDNLDLQILGMASAEAPPLASFKMKRRQVVKVDAAFGRRW